MTTVMNNKLSHLPSEQLSWLLSIKDIFKRTFQSNTKGKSDLITAIQHKANQRGYREITLLLDAKDLETYFKF